MNNVGKRDGSGAWKPSLVPDGQVMLACQARSVVSVARVERVTRSEDGRLPRSSAVMRSVEDPCVKAAGWPEQGGTGGL